MNHNKLRIGFLIAVLLTVLINLISEAQVIVDNKNLNDDKDLEYIRLMYYIERSTMLPVYFVDYGLIEPDFSETPDPESTYHDVKITINGDEIHDRLTPVGVLNKLHKAGWAYTGDVVFLPMGGMKHWHVLTLKRNIETSRNFPPGYHGQECDRDPYGDLIGTLQGPYRDHYSYTMKIKSWSNPYTSQLQQQASPHSGPIQSV